MEEKLLAYRRKKSRERFLNNIKYFWKDRSWFGSANMEEKENEIFEEKINEAIDSGSDSNDESENTLTCTKEEYLKYLAKSVIWFTLFLIAVKIEFGFVFLGFSLLFFIYFNTRTTPKKSGEKSAYSVFNANCEAIDGSLTAEQMEREMVRGIFMFVQENIKEEIKFRHLEDKQKCTYNTNIISVYKFQIRMTIGD